MDRQDAIKCLEALSMCGEHHNSIALGNTDREALTMAAADMRKLQYLEGRPCEVCSCHNEKGCGVWECMFDGKENV